VLSVERLLPAALLGGVLGWLRWRSGSVLPGVLLHLLHNGLLVSVALFPGVFGPVAAELEGARHVPPLWLALAAAGTAAGVGLALTVKRQVDPPRTV
jgi:ABC-2 type transport system permease protein/sodium transport system permease protein